MTPKTKREIGREGEDLACSFLKSKGWIILDRNYYFEHAEIDIIARDTASDTTVFIEVKMRKDPKFGQPMEFVTDDKVKLIYKAAEAWIHEHEIEDTPVRFDIIGILNPENSKPVINHIPDAFR